MSCRNKTYFKYTIDDLFPAHDIENKNILDLKIKVAEKHFIEDPKTMKVIVKQQILKDDLIINEHISMNDDINIVFLSTTKFYTPNPIPQQKNPLPENQINNSKLNNPAQSPIPDLNSNENVINFLSSQNSQTNPPNNTNFTSPMQNKMKLPMFDINQNKSVKSDFTELLNKPMQFGRSQNVESLFPEPNSFINMAMSFMKSSNFVHPPDEEKGDEQPNLGNVAEQFFKMGDEKFEMPSFDLLKPHDDDENKDSQPSLASLIQDIDSQEDENPEPEEMQTVTERPKVSPVSSMTLEDYEEARDMIIGMGFDEKIAIHALNHSNGNVDDAMEYIFSNTSEEGFKADDQEKIEAKDVPKNDDGDDFGLPQLKNHGKKHSYPAIVKLPNPADSEAKERKATKKYNDPISSDSTELESPEQILLSECRVENANKNDSPSSFKNNQPMFGFKENGLNFNSLLEHSDLDNFNMDNFLKDNFSKKTKKKDLQHPNPQKEQFKQTPNAQSPPTITPKPQMKPQTPQQSVGPESNNQEDFPPHIKNILHSLSEEQTVEVSILIGDFESKVSETEIIELYESCERNMENTYAILENY